MPISLELLPRRRAACALAAVGLVLTGLVSDASAQSPARLPLRRLDRAAVVRALAAATEASPADLSHCDLSGLHLDGLDFKRANLAGSNLAAATLTRAAMFGVTLNDADATGADFSGAVLDVAVLRGTTLTRAVLRGASLYATILLGAHLDQADLTDVRLIGAAAGADLRGATLTHARLGADRANQPMGIMRTDLTGADLTGAHLVGADLRKVLFVRADLTDADIADADLAGADFRLARGLDRLRGRSHARNVDRAFFDAPEPAPAAPPAAVAAVARTAGMGEGAAVAGRMAATGDRPVLAVMNAVFYGARANSIEPGDSLTAEISTAVLRRVLGESAAIVVADSTATHAAAIANESSGIRCGANIDCARAAGRSVGARWVLLAKISKTSNLIWYFSGQLVDVERGTLLLDDEFELKGPRDDLVPHGALALARRALKVATRPTAPATTTER